MSDDYYDPFICPPNDPECNPAQPSDKVSYYDSNVGHSTPIMKYSKWPEWSKTHYALDGTVLITWW